MAILELEGCTPVGLGNPKLLLGTAGMDKIIEASTVEANI